MKYMGSKNRIAKYILPLMLSYKNERDWVEPFVGGGNLIDKVEGVRYGYDKNPHVINALKTIRDEAEKTPKNNLQFTEEDYKKLRFSDDYIYKSYAGFAFSYSGKWMGGWCRDSLGKRDYVNEAYKNAIKQQPKLKNVILECKDYKDIKLNNPSLIYCDPPYKNSTKYNINGFNYEEFYNQCRLWKKEGHFVFVSEYEMPEDFRCIWSKEIVSSLTKNTGSKKAIEKLFVLK